MAVVAVARGEGACRNTGPAEQLAEVGERIACGARRAVVDFLQRRNVRLRCFEHVRDAIGIAHSVPSDAAVHVPRQKANLQRRHRGERRLSAHCMPKTTASQSTIAPAISAMFCGVGSRQASIAVWLTNANAAIPGNMPSAVPSMKSR